MDTDILIIGAGPAGLMAAERLGAAGYGVDIFDAMASPARKFLRAGIGGLNLTHSEPFPALLDRFGERAEVLEPYLRAFGPDQMRQWAAGLGIETFVGSSGRVFPRDFKAAPLLRAWLRRLREQGARLHMRHRWLGWDKQGRHVFATPTGEIAIAAPAAILALGGGSWPQLGSDGAWTEILHDQPVIALKPANCGFDLEWSAHFRDRFAGAPVKSVVLDFAGRRLKGEFVITATGVEGSAIYALSAPLRDAIAANGQAVVHVDLKPDWTTAKLAQALAKPRGSRSLASHLERQAGLKDVSAGLVREILAQEQRTDASALKALPLVLRAPRPLAEAISSAGGLSFDAVHAGLMLKSRAGIFVAGEMLDWEAPTGGYLLTACMALGHAAGQAAAVFLHQNAGKTP